MVGFIKKGLNLTIAYTKWALSGKPLRDDEYIFSLYDDHCKDCELFTLIKENEGECNECGCHIKRVPSSEDTFNKLAWPTEGCPVGKWTADIDEDTSSA